MPALKNHRAAITVAATLPASPATNGSPPTNGSAAFAPACRGRLELVGTVTRQPRCRPGQSLRRRQ